MHSFIRWSTAGLAIGSLAIAIYLAAGMAGSSKAGVVNATVSISSTSVPTSSQATVDLIVTPESGITIGALRVLVGYENAVVTPVACTNANYANTCNISLSPSEVGFAYASLTGVSGTVGTITFNTPSSEAVANLTVTLTTCADEHGIDLTCGTADGTITITQPTPTPIPTASPTPSPGPTPPPTATPIPTPTPVPFRWGDVNCDGNVNSVDALALLRKSAGLPVFQVQPCPLIGAEIFK